MLAVLVRVAGKSPVDTVPVQVMGNGWGDSVNTGNTPTKSFRKLNDSYQLTDYLPLFQCLIASSLASEGH